MEKQYDSIIFDFDGTLFQTEKLAVPSFEKTFQQLKEEGYSSTEWPTEEQMLSVIGMTLDQIWNELLPDLPREAHLKANQYMLQNELEGVKEGYGALYPGVVETLMELKNRGYRLFVASNGLKEYIHGVSEAFRIEHYFDAMYAADEYKTESKKDLIKKLVEDHSIRQGIMVGDRHSDVEAGLTNQLLVVGCDFGFATDDELDGAHLVIQKFPQLMEVLDF